MTASLLSVVLALAADPSSEIIVRPPPLSLGTAALLSFAADERVPLPRRCDAIADLDKRGEIAAVPRLAAMLPGEGGLDTRELILALGNLGGPKALAALEEFEAKAKKGDVDYHGKIWTALSDGLERLRKEQSTRRKR